MHHTQRYITKSLKSGNMRQEESNMIAGIKLYIDKTA